MKILLHLFNFFYTFWIIRWVCMERGFGQVRKRNDYTFWTHQTIGLPNGSHRKGCVSPRDTQFWVECSNWIRHLIVLLEEDMFSTRRKGDTWILIRLRYLCVEVPVHQKPLLLPQYLFLSLLSFNSRICFLSVTDF